MAAVKGRAPDISNDQGVEKQAIASHLKRLFEASREPQEGPQRAIQSFLKFLPPHDHGKTHPRQTTTAKRQQVVLKCCE
jgi:hypothetical protein